MKHTPGPWFIDDRTPVKTSINSNNKHIAIVNFFHEGSNRDVVGDEHLANANLIASAPEILEALNRILYSNEIDHSCTDSTYCKQDRESCDLCFAEKAIKKSRGQ